MEKQCERCSNTYDSNRTETKKVGYGDEINHYFSQQCRTSRLCENCLIEDIAKFIEKIKAPRLGHHRKMKIIDVPTDERFITKVAEVLFDGFATSGVNPWANLTEAIEEVRESLAENRISRAALDENENILGWIAGFHEYALVWELHPLVVRSDLQNQGIGSALVKDFEKQVKSRGGLTVRLGTDDENNRTSIGGVDLYPNVLEKLSGIKNLRRHPFEFYQKLGYEITGAIPDANGFGKPDIIMCKRV